MFHELVNETLGTELGFALQNRLKEEGYFLVDGSFDDLEIQDIRDAWNELSLSGAEAVVDYLETSFGFFFEQKG